MRTFEFLINEDMTSYIERLAFETEGQKRIIKELIMENTDNASLLDGETFKKFQARYEEKAAAYEIAKKELQNTQIPKTLLEHNTNTMSWELDFRTSILKVTMHCDCFDNVSMEDILNGTEA